MFYIAIATRLKRKIFLAGNITESVRKETYDAAEKNKCRIINCQFRPYGMEFMLDCDTEQTAKQVVKCMRYATSGPVRKRYPELWKMPSLWARKYLIVETDGKFPPNKIVEEYYDSLKSR